MPKAKVGEIELEYETFGSDDDPALLLVCGLGSQLIRIYSEFCELLAGLGLFVIRYDHRDMGLSSKIDAQTPALGDVVSGATQPVYKLDDMADDGAGLIRELGVGPAHIWGMSMGGMIAQLIAVRQPGDVRSLTSMMSNTGWQDAPPPAPEAAQMLARPPGETPEARIEQGVAGARVLASPGFPFDAARARSLAEAQERRAFTPEGVARQVAAIMSAPSRIERLERLELTALVLHGEDDVLVRVDGGKMTAAAIPGARLRTYPGWSHDLPEPFWGTLVDDYSRFLKEAAATG